MKKGSGLPNWRDRFRRLSGLGFSFDALESSWQRSFDRLLAYQDDFGDCSPAARHPHDPALGAWAARQRQLYHSGNLPQARARMLDAAGFEWDRPFPLRKGRPATTLVAPQLKSTPQRRRGDWDEEKLKFRIQQLRRRLERDGEADTSAEGGAEGRVADPARERREQRERLQREILRLQEMVQVDEAMAAHEETVSLRPGHDPCAEEARQGEVAGVPPHLSPFTLPALPPSPPSPPSPSPSVVPPLLLPPPAPPGRPAPWQLSSSPSPPLPRARAIIPTLPVPSEPLPDSHSLNSNPSSSSSSSSSSMPTDAEPM